MKKRQWLQHYLPRRVATAEEKYRCLCYRSTHSSRKYLTDCKVADCKVARNSPMNGRDFRCRTSRHPLAANFRNCKKSRLSCFLLNASSYRGSHGSAVWTCDSVCERRSKSAAALQHIGSAFESSGVKRGFFESSGIKTRMHFRNCEQLITGSDSDTEVLHPTSTRSSRNKCRDSSHESSRGNSNSCRHQSDQKSFS